MPGRPKKPTKLKIIQGTARKDRINLNEPMPDPGIPAAPDFLSNDALIEWGRMSNHLFKMGLLTEIDRSAFVQYCQAWGRVVKYEKVIKEKGELIKTPNGSIQISPALSIVNKAYEQLSKAESKLGLSPADRAKVHVEPKKKEDNPFLKRRAKK